MCALCNLINCNKPKQKKSSTLAFLTSIWACSQACSAACLGASVSAKILSRFSNRAIFSSVMLTGAGERKIANRPKSQRNPTPKTFGFLWSLALLNVSNSWAPGCGAGRRLVDPRCSLQPCIEFDWLYADKYIFVTSLIKSKWVCLARR